MSTSRSPTLAPSPSVVEEVPADVDEPPDCKASFKRTIVAPRPRAPQRSLLTMALRHTSDEDDEASAQTFALSSKRRSMRSSISNASTADLTSDTGITSPSRADTPSPPIPEINILSLQPVDSRKLPVGPVVIAGNNSAGCAQTATAADESSQPEKQPIAAAVEPPKKRCISFACTAKPFGAARAPIVEPKAEKPQEPARKPCIKFACAKVEEKRPVTPVSKQDPSFLSAGPAQPSPSRRKTRSPSVNASSRSSTPRRTPQKTTPPIRRRPYISEANADFDGEASRFHEFASGVVTEDDWIRHAKASPKRKLTIDDILVKENAIRKLGREVEEEVEQEQEEEEEENNASEDDEDEAADDDDDVDEDEDEDEADEDEEDDDVEDVHDNRHNYSYHDPEGSDGYKTDEETGFADSDDEEDGNDEFMFWNPFGATRPPIVSSGGHTPVIARRASVDEHASDSSLSGSAHLRIAAQRPPVRSRRIKIRPRTPELPDSTDFVCGTLDEDRPLEDAYKSCIEARKREKLHVIPQDFDPSFPTSEPEDDSEDENVGGARRDSDDHDWLHGELDDLHHEGARGDRRRKSNAASPRRYHSPPPKPRHRGRSPRRLFDTHSPRRLRSPAPPHHHPTSPPGSPATPTARAITFGKPLGAQQGLNMTKSLPRVSMLFPNHIKCRNKPIHHPPHRPHNTAARKNGEAHVRGAIDITRGLEHRRQRRREKFMREYCTRARRGQIPERKAPPGIGCERMREHILGPSCKNADRGGHYMLSV